MGDEFMRKAGYFNYSKKKKNMTKKNVKENNNFVFWDPKSDFLQSKKPGNTKTIFG